MNYKLNEIEPKIDPSAYIAPGAHLIGNVELKEEATVWFNAVLRGDEEKIEVGEKSNVQDGVVIHTDPGYPVTIGSNVTIGHNVTLHGCTVENNALIGMGATILNGAVIKEGALVAAGALVPEGKVIEAGTLVAGVPVRTISKIDQNAVSRMIAGAESYVNRGKQYKENGI